MHELEGRDFFHTSKFIVTILIIVGAVLLLALLWEFFIKRGMSADECKGLILMAVLYVPVVIGAVFGDC